MRAVVSFDDGIGVITSDIVSKHLRKKLGIIYTDGASNKRPSIVLLESLNKELF